MFDRLIRWAEVRRALRSERYDEALRLLDDPLLRRERRAGEFRLRALTGLLDRAERRLEVGDPEAARIDVERVISIDDERVRERARAVEEVAQSRLASREEARTEGATLWRRARELADNGELSAADEVVRQAFARTGDRVDRDAMAQRIAERRERAIAARAACAEALRSGDLGVAKERLRDARGADRTATELPELAQRVARRVVDDSEPDMRRRVESATEHRAALQDIRAEVARLPELAADRRVGAWIESARATEQAALAAAFDAVSLDSDGRDECTGDQDATGASSSVVRLIARYREAVALDAVDPDSDVGTAAAALDRGVELREQGDLVGAVAALDGLSSSYAKSVRELRRSWERERDTQAIAMAAAQRAIAIGAHDDARDHLVSVLTRWPLHAGARREFDRLERGIRMRDDRLAEARQHAAEARLQTAFDLVLPLAVPGAGGAPARLLLEDLQARLEVVQAGVDQVRRALHGRASSHRDGLRHCLLRLEQLALVQVDSDEIEQLTAALRSEIEGLDAFDAAGRALASDDPVAFATAVQPWADLRGRLLTPDRLDARRLELVDAVVQRMRECLDGARLSRADRWSEAVAGIAIEDDAVRERLLREQTRGEARKETALRHVDDGMAALERRDLAEAEARLSDARGEWVDGAEVERLADALCAVDRRIVDVHAVESLAAARDFAGAHRKLSSMDPTPPLLRTRMFDLKQSLARAQGLEGAFVLRVDEGGEFLVVRGESVSIGNVRDAQADLPVLANLAGCHARVTRSMSFHGGMQDTIRAERGELLVAGRSVTEHQFGAGDEVRLGRVFGLRYGQPCRRSLTTALILTGGFQIGGTDKILLFKDRGKDGRIVIGDGGDVHVKVPHAGPEVEIFATKDGQLRVRCDGGGEIDGKPFGGEHPVPAGALIRCGETAFQVQPWNPER